MAREMDEFVAKVKDSTDILKVISTYVPLKKSGSNYFGCCPFHREKTPSFSVAADKGFFYCFGCHAGGDVFKFLSLIEGISYFEAIKKEAERLHIDMPEREKSPFQIERERKIAQMLKANELASKFFHSALVNTSLGIAAKEYLLSRGIGEEVIEEFKFGFSPNSWDRLTNALKERNVTEETLLCAGLISRARESAKVFDRFRGRVMIPIADLKGKIVAFGGRAMGDEQPKYLNTAETPVFKKGEMLFNLDKAHLSIRKEEFAIIVEGYMDAISLYAAGITNVVASLGTAFTAGQAKLLMRYAKRFYFCYDSDEAGQNATVRALQIAANLGAEIFVINIPDGKDPDEFVRKHSKEAFLNLIQTAYPLLDFRLQYVLKHTNYNSLEGKIKALHEMLPILGAVKNEAVKLEYQKKLARVLMLDEGVIVSELKNMKLTPALSSGAVFTRKATVKSESMLERAGRIIIKEAIEDEGTIDYIREVLPVELVENEGQREIFNMLFKYGGDYNIESLSEEATEELSRAIVETFDGEISDVYIDALNAFEKQDLINKMQTKSKEIEEAMANGVECEDKLAEIMEINKKLNILKKGG